MTNTNTVRLHRVIRAPAERIYRAFLEPGAIAKWLPPYGFICTVHHLDAKVGGTYKMSFTNFGAGGGNSFAANTLSWYPTTRSATPTSLTTPTCPAP